MPSETEQPKMWTNYDHDHVRPHVRGGLKKQLPPKKKSGAGDEDDDVCPPVKDRLIRACHRPLISPTYISSRTNRNIFGRKSKKSKLEKNGRKQSSEVQGQNCAAQSKAGRVHGTVWGEGFIILSLLEKSTPGYGPELIITYYWPQTFIFCMLLKVRFKSVGFKIFLETISKCATKC